MKVLMQAEELWSVVKKKFNCKAVFVCFQFNAHVLVSLFKVVVSAFN